MSKRTWKLTYLDRLTLGCVLRCLPHVSHSHIADAFGIDRRSVNHHAPDRPLPRPLGRPRSVLAEDVEAAQSLIAEGRSIVFAARTVGVNYWTLCKRLRRSKPPPDKMDGG